MKTDFYVLLLAVSGALLAASCRPGETKAGYYNIDSLLQEQALSLASARAGLRKQAEINEVHHDTTFVPKDSAAWARELDIFAEIGFINKPINIGSYEVRDGISDSLSNLTIRAYTAKPDKELPVVYLKTYYHDSPLKLRKLEALYHQKNALSESNRKLVMEFTDIYNKTILTSYSIEGDQKMFVGEPVNFIIIGTVAIK